MSNIQKCVEALPEVYQNIFNHPEYNEDTSRNCEERLGCLTGIVKAYQEYSGTKELKVLDLGCAQGFYSFSLASLGCEVRGIDFNEQNIALCKELQQENGLSCLFEKDIVSTELIDQIEDGLYDVIMIFSVIHHIANEHGFEYAKTIMTKLAGKAKFVLTELAVKEEPLYWKKNLPVHYTDWFSDVAFFDEQEFFGTHLSEYKRPFVFYSNKLCFFKESFFSITEYKKSAYEGKPEDPGKRYYLCDDNTKLIKVFRDIEPFFKTEIHTEEAFLKQNNDLDFVPELIFFEENPQRIAEITGIHYGVLLSDLIKNHAAIDFPAVFRDIIDECVKLEERNYYHNDLRPWNICVGENGQAFLIDFGSIQNDVTDHVACAMEEIKSVREHTVFETFIAMVYDCLRGNIYKSIKEVNMYQMSFYYDFNSIPLEFADFIKKFLLENVNNVSFQKIRTLFHTYVINKEKCDLSIEDFVRLQEIQLAGLNIQKEESINARVRAHALDKDTDCLNMCISDVKMDIQKTKRQMNDIKQQMNDIKQQILELNDMFIRFERSYSNAEAEQRLFFNRNRDLLNNIEMQLEENGRRMNEYERRIGLVDSWLVLRFWRKTATLISYLKKAIKRLVIDIKALENK